MTDVVHTRPALRGRSTRLAAAVFLLLTAVHLVAQLAGSGPLADRTQWFLMPALAAVLWCATAAPRPRLVRLVLVALAFSWVGDTLPDLFDGDAAFLAMVGGFLVAQVVYAVAFWPHRRDSVLRRPAVLAVYVLAAVVLVGLCLPGAGVLGVAVVVYALCLGTMAVLSTGVHRLAAIGGAVFLASDAMIALGAFTDWFAPPLDGFWVMLTYLAGQTLLVAGVLARR
ncbi:putative membrane protein YhhN [Isoptericola jiangsuensis]|uniref:Putative membrane protein YhhN n=1 Tax=Isoptericola jiangsuensis TaxID=548579 RepID=A0A2A9EYZ7_9MICO|nr:lysoplasmalogenase [Isoptericola jiangsuensis]PFG43445.1 putative membrane protein YhhN [Isoptericola jiangsuensis]